MNTLHRTPPQPPARHADVPHRPGLLHRLRPYLPDVAAFAGALVSAALAAVLLGSLHGCGGGVGGEGTGSFALGPISGFGSIYVNGVRFDDSAAELLDDDGATLPRSSLALGTMVEVSGGAIGTDVDGQSVALAQRVQAIRALVGPVTAVDAAGGSLVVLGQTVRTTANTVVDAGISGGLAGIALGQTLTVYGTYDASSASWRATRIALAATGDAWRVRGEVGTVDTAAKTFVLGSQTYSYASLGTATGLVTGSVVQLAVQSRGEDGRWTVSRESKADRSTAIAGTEAELECQISSLLSATRFTADGVTVDAANAKVSGSLRQGAAVKVSGRMVNGVLVATQVTVQDDSTERGFELRGTVSALDTAQRRLVLRGITVGYARSDLQLSGGTLADLAVGRSLRVTGVLSSDRTRLDAQRIEFK